MAQAFKVGDIVQLKSGGLRMVLTRRPEVMSAPPVFPVRTTNAGVLTSRLDPRANRTAKETDDLMVRAKTRTDADNEILTTS